MFETKNTGSIAGKLKPDTIFSSFKNRVLDTIGRIDRLIEDIVNYDMSHNPKDLIGKIKDKLNSILGKTK